MAESSASVVTNNANIVNKLSSVQSSDSSDENKTDKAVMKPISVDDFRYGGILPQSAKNVLDFLEETKPDAGQVDILVALIYVLMLEAKFFPEENDEDCDDIAFNYSKILKYSKKMSVVRSKGVQRLNFMFPDFRRTKCSLTCVEAGEDLLVNLTVSGLENEFFSFCLDPATYFLSCQASLRRPGIQNVHHLSREVKNKVIIPATEEIMSFYEIHYLGHTCFMCIPDSVILKILSYLKVRDQLHFCRTCREMYYLTFSPSFWSSLISRDFKDWSYKNQPSDAASLKMVYKSLRFRNRHPGWPITLPIRINMD